MVEITQMKDLFAKFIDEYGWEIGAHTYCPPMQGRPNVRFADSGAKLKIGKYCSLADNITFMLGGNHRTDWITTYPFTQIDGWNAEHITGHPATKGDIVIGNDVYIGSGAWIMSGVTVGDGAVIGAMSVVTKNVPPYSIVAGNPAKEVGYRDLASDIAFFEWWNWPEEKIREAAPLLCSSNLGAINSFYHESVLAGTETCLTE